MPRAVEGQLSGENACFLVAASFHTRNAPGQCQAASGHKLCEKVNSCILPADMSQR